MSSAISQIDGLRTSRVLVVDDDIMVRELLRSGLEQRGIVVDTAESGLEALVMLQSSLPDLLVTDVNMPDIDGFELLSQLRSDPATRSLPTILLTARTGSADVVLGLGLGADDYVVKPFDMGELVSRVTAKLDRPPVPVDQLMRNRRTGLLRRDSFLEDLNRELDRSARSQRGGALAVMDLDGRQIRDRFGELADDELARHLVLLLEERAGRLHLVGRDDDGNFLILMPEESPNHVRTYLSDLVARTAAGRFVVAGERVSVTPTVGWVQFAPVAETVSGEVLLERAALAMAAAASHLDLQPVAWTPELEDRDDLRRRPRAERLRQRLRTPMQILATGVLGILVPFVLYVGMYKAGTDISNPIFLLVVGALIVTGASIWAEGFLALDPMRPPRDNGAPPPPASAVIAAYLPNEAATVLETVESFLLVDYPDLQVVLAYNTPRRLPVEAELEAIAARDPRFLPLLVHGSTSKAQNVNAALGYVTGDFVGVFDADHHPATDAFRRAWRWLSNGFDVVQGHCVVRNGDASWVARIIAVEFEAIYAVSHPGRARLHGFGVFGGSNGYWKTDLLRGTRMRGQMLTEDIDSSLRVVADGGHIANDPGLISRELAPTTVQQVWNQRMRWAQGWFQVSLKHLVSGWRSPNLSFRQKFGITFLLGWREIYPWISIQIIPLIAFFAWRAGGVTKLDFFIPVFVLSTLFTLSVGPSQVFFAYRLAVPELRRHRSWFVSYFFWASIVYTEWKNVIARVAQLKEVLGDRQWKVTPRAAPIVSEAIGSETSGSETSGSETSGSETSGSETSGSQASVSGASLSGSSVSGFSASGSSVSDVAVSEDER